ncbi:MAG: alpha-ketoacid dehydrogenase subunit beta [Armatimonadetes bacterium]|nr:alpha-ketoacid dehydrogenase subunit beta [Armatimonadota bacterium]
MAVLTYREAITRALDEEMSRDGSVVLFGEDVAKAGGVFKATPGLYEKFGALRVRDTPISETAIIGAAIGAAMTGLRPVAELMFADFVAVCLDQIVNQAAKLRYMSRGKIKAPLTIRGAQGAGTGFASQHSQCVETLLMHNPGIKVAAPATPADALGLLKTAIRDDNPVMFLEHKMMYNEKGDVPAGDYLVPFGKAAVLREGKDVTVVAVQRMVKVASEAAEQLAEEGISCEVLDLRTLVPMDIGAVISSVERTGHLVTVEEAVETCGWGAEVVSRVASESIWNLDGPPLRVTLGESIIPFSEPLEEAIIPNPARVISAVRSLMAH